MYDKAVINQLREFIDTKITSDYDFYEKFYGDTFLCRIFRYEPVDMYQSPLLGADGKPLVNESKRRIMTIAKVIAIGDKSSYDGLQVGDIVAISDNFIGQQTNPEFVQFMIETNGEMSRGVEAVKPQQTISNFVTYRNQYGFLGDKVKETNEFDPNDFFTFLLPTSFIKAKYDIKKFKLWMEKVSGNASLN